MWVLGLGYTDLAADAIAGQTFRTDGSTAELLELVKSASTGGHRAILVTHTAYRRIPRDELMRRVVIDTTRLTHKFFVALRKSLSLDRTRPT